MGGATEHAPGCEVAELIAQVLAWAAPPDAVEVWTDAQPPPPEWCQCRTCGHDAAVHVYDGSCLECGRVRCWR